MILKILISTFNRDKILQATINAIDSNTKNKGNVEVIVFNNNQRKLNIKKPSKDLKLTIIDTYKNTGKTFNFWNYVINDNDQDVFYCSLDDKLIFINSIDKIVDTLKLKKFNVYTLMCVYKNHPFKRKKSLPFNEGDSLRKHFFNKHKKEKLPLCADRVYTFHKNIVEREKRHIRKMLKFNYLQSEISISAHLIHHFFYKDKCGIIENDKPYIFCEYQNGGCTLSKNWELINCPNSYLYEQWLFAWDINIYNFIKNSFLFCVYYRKTENKECHKNFVFKFILLSPIYYLCKIYFLLCKNKTNKTS